MPKLNSIRGENNLNSNELVNVIEAVLFASGEPVSIQRLCQTFEVEHEDIVEAIEILKNRLENTSLDVITLENTYQLCTKKQYGEHIKNAFEIKRKTLLSQAGFEVLAVVAYNQPVTKAFIEQVRGVDCTAVMTTLLEKELIEEKGRLELPGRPLLYGTTKNFLRCFSISDLSELPQLSKDENNTTEPDLAEQLEVGINNSENADN